MVMPFTQQFIIIIMTVKIYLFNGDTVLVWLNVSYVNGGAVLRLVHSKLRQIVERGR